MQLFYLSISQKSKIIGKFEGKMEALSTHEARVNPAVEGAAAAGGRHFTTALVRREWTGDGRVNALLS